MGVDTKKCHLGGRKKYSLLQRCSFIGSIVAPHRKRGVLELEVSAWSKIVEDLLCHCFVALEASDDGSSMHKIKRFGERPTFFGIRNLEVTVHWYAETIR